MQNDYIPRVFSTSAKFCLSSVTLKTSIMARMLWFTMPKFESHTHIWFLLCVQYIPRNMHTVFALMCFVVVIHWLIFPYPSGLLHCHCGNLTIAPVPAKQPWWIWINTSCEFIMNDCITTTKQSTTKPCAYFLGYTVCRGFLWFILSQWLLLLCCYWDPRPWLLQCKYIVEEEWKNRSLRYWDGNVVIVSNFRKWLQR